MLVTFMFHHSEINVIFSSTDEAVKLFCAEFRWRGYIVATV